MLDFDVSSRRVSPSRSVEVLDVAFEEGGFPPCTDRLTRLRDVLLSERPSPSVRLFDPAICGDTNWMRGFSANGEGARRLRGVTIGKDDAARGQRGRMVVGYIMSTSLVA